MALPLATSSKKINMTAWTAQIIAAGILTAMGWLPKLTGDPLSVALSEKIGGDPVRLLVGVSELVGVVLLLVPITAPIGGVFAVGLMFGAIASHLGPLGIVPEVTVDGETTRLAALMPAAVVTLLLGASVALLRRDRIPVVGKTLAQAI
ncbi:MAG: DoxX family protein [Planctomycetota bacterium]